MWEFGNSGIWEFGILGREFGNLGREFGKEKELGDLGREFGKGGIPKGRKFGKLRR